MTEVIEGMLTEPTSVTIYENGSSKTIAKHEKRSLFDMEPAEQMRHGALIATELSNVIKKQKLFKRIGEKDYVLVEAWELAGTFLGILPRERLVTECTNGDFEASVDLVRQADGVVVGGASAICGMDENTWKSRPRYARRSMAVTRAVGKAYRISFSWIISLAGYEPTPAEEMPEDKTFEIPFEPRKQVRVSDGGVGADQKGSVGEKRNLGSIYTGTTEQQEKVKAYLVKNKVPEDLWSTIDDRLQGKPSGELKQIVADLTAIDQ